VPLWRLSNSLLYSLFLHCLSAAYQLQKVNFLKLNGVNPYYDADCGIPEFDEIPVVIFWRWKNARKSI
jgi:hypothetical protein